MNKLKNYLLIITLGSFIAISCNTEDNPLTNEELKIADSLFRIKEVNIQPSLDSLCDSLYKKNYPAMVDSIKKIRQEEVIKLLKE